MPTPSCLYCGYNLTGVATRDRPRGACPECGRGYDMDEVLEPPLHTRPGRWWLQLLGPGVFMLNLALLFMTGWMLEKYRLENNHVGSAALFAHVFLMPGVALVTMLVTPMYVVPSLSRQLARRPPRGEINAASVTVGILLYVGLVTGQVIFGLICATFLAMSIVLALFD